MAVSEKLAGDKSQRTENSPPTQQYHPPSFASRRLPRIETCLAFAALAFSILAKVFVLDRQHAIPPFTPIANVVLPDVLFFLGLLVVIRLLYVLRPSKLVARTAIILVFPAVAWSLLNAAWLRKVGVQLQPAILTTLLRNPRQIWPIAAAHFRDHLGYTVALALTAVLAVALPLWKLYRPAPILSVRSHHARQLLTVFCIIAILSLSAPVLTAENTDLTVQVLAYSSHFHALRSLLPTLCDNSTAAADHLVPLLHDSKTPLFQKPPGETPNIVLILLESIPYSQTSLTRHDADPTPYLAELATRSVSFTTTRAVVSHTSKAMWTMLTSTTPTIEQGYVEAVIADHPPLSLPLILARHGYRSAFFKMAKGTFECAPGLCKNLGFDYAWFRENLEDPSANLGYFAGDDVELIDPAVKWALDDGGPFFLTILTSVCHDPYEVPSWYAKPADRPIDRYRQTVEYTDYFLRVLCERLQNEGLDENTILCIIGDHGTSFRQVAGTGRWCPYEETIRVPWIINWPGRITAGRRISSPCSHLDLTPTILSLMGFELAGAPFEGLDALSNNRPHRRFYFSAWYENSPLGYIETNRKFIYWPDIEAVFEYDLVADPNEQCPRRLTDARANAVINEILTWRDKSRISIDSRRFREALLYGHWETFSQGRRTWSYYVP